MPGIDKLTWQIVAHTPAGVRHNLPQPPGFDCGLLTQNTKHSVNIVEFIRRVDIVSVGSWLGVRLDRINPSRPRSSLAFALTNRQNSIGGGSI
jgi:hypothetical protein